MYKQLKHLGILSILTVLACRGGGESKSGSPSASQPQPPPEAAQNTPKPAPSARTTLEPWRPLLDEAARAELSIGGLFIDLGTADQHKYTRGGWRTGWRENEQDGSVTLSGVGSSKATLELVTHASAGEIAFRARSAVQGQRAVVYIGDDTVGEADIGAAWSIVRVPLAKPLAAGRHKLAIRLSRRASGKPRAEFDWVWLPASAGAEPPEAPGIRALPIRVGEQPKRALIAPEPRSYSFYLQPPPGARLVFDYGSQAGATFRVAAHTDGAPPAVLFTGKGSPTWAEAVVDLGELADRAVRLELSTTGPAGVTGWGEPVVMTAPKTAEPPRIDRSRRPKNVVFLVIDTVRADAFAPFGTELGVEAPQFDEFAAGSTVFVNAYNNENWTKPSVATTLSSVYPSTHDTKRDASTLPGDIVLLPQHLRKHGFATAGFVANGYVSKKFGFEKGWDTFRNYIREGRPSEAEHVYADALAWLEQDRDKPFFLYIQTIDPHVTYKVPKPYTEPYFKGEYDGVLGTSIDADELAGLSNGKIKGNQRDIDWVRALYFGEVTYHDEHMGAFFDALDEAGRLEDTLIVITNDHGEELGDHGAFGHGHTLYEDLIRAPLVMRFPARLPAGLRVPEVSKTSTSRRPCSSFWACRRCPTPRGSRCCRWWRDRPASGPITRSPSSLTGAARSG